MARADKDAIRRAIEPAVLACGLDLEAVDVRAAGRRSVLRVVVDADGGVSLDAVAEVSRAVSEMLDPTDLMGGTPYVLEVSSPGVDRALTELRHWRRATQRLVEVAVRGVLLTARIRAVDAAGVQLAYDAGDGPGHVPFADLGPGRVVVEFGRLPADRSDEPADEPADEEG